MYEIVWTKRSVKQLKKFPRHDQTKIYETVQIQREWPKCSQVKSLINRNDYRIRVGQYRVIFTIDKGIKVIKVEEVKKRDEQTY